MTIQYSKLARLALCATTVVLGGCEVLKNNAFVRGDVRVGGATPIIETNSFQEIDLALQLSPDSKGINQSPDLNDQRETLREAFEEFYEEPTDQKLRRNRVQERILAASNQRCGEYKIFLKDLDAKANFILGSLTTAVAGAGAIFTPASTVRALSGIAAIFSGVRAEFNEDFFANLTIQVITDGLDASRSELYEKMKTRQRKTLINYTVEEAIKDAVTYHANCSLIAGLEHAALSIERAANPGLQGMKKALLQTRELQRIMNADETELFPIISLSRLSIDPTSFPGDVLDEEILPSEALQRIESEVIRIDLSFRQQVNKTSNLLKTEINKTNITAEKKLAVIENIDKAVETIMEARKKALGDSGEKGGVLTAIGILKSRDKKELSSKTIRDLMGEFTDAEGDPEKRRDIRNKLVQARTNGVARIVMCLRAVRIAYVEGIAKARKKIKTSKKISDDETVFLNAVDVIEGIPDQISNSLGESCKKEPA